MIQKTFIPIKAISIIALIMIINLCLTIFNNAVGQVLINGKVFTTAKGSAAFFAPSDLGEIGKAGQPLENEACVFVDADHQYQRFVGIGGALTDAAAETFYALAKEQQEKILKLYFDKQEGIGYTLCRTNINSCDFSSDMYTYVKDGDKTLASFDIGHDLKYKIPLIKEAINYTGGRLKLFASPWSPPAYMKTNNHMLKGGHLLPEYFNTYAMYYVKFIQHYRKHGINLWGISVQNEPMATQTWESCIYTAEEELQFVKNHLGPALHKNKLKNIKLIAWDHNRDLLYQRANHLLRDKVAAKYIWGIGFHWYEIWNGGRQYENVKRVHESFPQTNLLLTEACNYPFSWQTINDWKWGEEYGENMIHDFNNGAVAWVDWNILLNEVGGPNHVQNYCFAPTHAKTNEQSIHLMNSYYYIGHFSKFIEPQAHRMSVSSNRAQLLVTGFINPDGKKVIIVMNKTEENLPYKLIIKNDMAQLTSQAHSIMTIVLDK